MSRHMLLHLDDHKELRVLTQRSPELGDAMMCCLTVPDEFRRVQGEYPILFRQTAERDGFTALAMFGFETGENLFLKDGRWDARYLPLAVAIQPFLVGPPAPGHETAQVHVDMESPRIGVGPYEDGVRVFDEDGRPTPYLESMAEKLGALDAGYRASADFFAALARHELLEPFTLEVTLDDGSENRLVGFHAIDEERLRSLDAEALGELHAEGHLMPIFMALASLSQLGPLIERRNAKARHG